MKLAEIEVADLIENGGFVIVDRVFSGEIPKETRPDKNSTDVLVTLATDVPTDYANNDFKSLSQMVEVQIFYSLNLEENAAEFEVKLMRFLQKNNWKVDQPKPRTTDPDTNQVTKVFYFSRKLKLKGDI